MTTLDIECYRDALIQGAKEFIAAGIYKHNGEEPGEYQTTEHQKMVRVCEELLEYFGVEKDENTK